MATLETRYLPADRLRALAANRVLPSLVTGSALFADISGFTPITERLRQSLGPRRGAETLALHLNRVYDALIAEIDRFGGTIISFAGDAVTCWFESEDAPLQAAACAFALLDAMQSVDQIVLPEGETTQIGLKVSIASGTARRFVVGAPDVQRIDVLAGTTVARMAAGEGEAERGEVIADAVTVEKLGTAVTVREWRGGERFAVLERGEGIAEVQRGAPLEFSPALDENVLRPWLLPAVVRQFEAGLGEYLTELRPAVAMFVRFAGIDYDSDPDAEKKLNEFLAQVQYTLTRYEGTLLQLTIGDKGSYLYAAFGAPYAHEDDEARALSASLDIRALAEALPYLSPLQMGISQGMMRTGAYGGETRRTYGVLGDEVNLAARLMTKAAPGEILVNASILSRRLDGFSFNTLAPVSVKGKSEPVGVCQLVGRSERTFERQFYTTPLVGRDAELLSLRRALQPLLEGKNAGIVYVQGDPGIGKSRLTYELQQRLQAETPLIWLVGQTDDILRAPLQPFAYLFRSYFEQRREDGRAANLNRFDARYDALLAVAEESVRDDLELYRSFMAGLIGLVLPQSLYQAADDKVRLDNTIVGLKAVVRTLSRQQPLVIHIEDAHGLGSSSVRALQNLTYGMDEVPFALVLTSRYRDDGTPFVLEQVSDVPAYTVDLGRLDADGVRQITERVIGGGVSERLLTFMRDRADGNPFFTEQLALALKEHGALVQTGEGWEVSTNAESDIPASINALLIARLDRLTAQVKAVVQTASVLGREFDVMVLSRMLRTGDEVYIKAAENAAVWIELSQLRYLFRHALLREAAYQMQVQARLKELHRTAAETIEQLYPDDPLQDSALLEHWFAAEVPARALHYLTRVAARQIDFAADYDEAERLLIRAQAYPESDYTARLLFQRGRVDAERGKFHEAAAQFQATLEWAGEDHGLRVEALNALCQVQRNLSNLPGAIAYAQQALGLARRMGSTQGAAQSLTSLAAVEIMLSEYDTAFAHLDESIALFREAGNQQGLVDALYQSARAYNDRGDLPRALTLYRQVHELAQKIGNRRMMVSTEGGMGIISSRQGDMARAEQHFTRALRFHEAIGNRAGIAGALSNLGAMHYSKGDYAAARAYQEQAIAIAEVVGDRATTLRARKNLADTLGVMGDYAAARAQFQIALTQARDLGDRKLLGQVLHGLAVQSFNEGNYTTARTEFEEALHVHRERGELQLVSESLQGLALTAYYLGEIEAARAHAEESEQIAEQAGDRLTQVFLLQLRADLEDEDYAAARVLLARALQLARDIEYEIGVGDALHAIGVNAYMRGDYTAAEHDLTEAVQIRRVLEDGELYHTLVWVARSKLRLGRLEEPRTLLSEACHIVLAKPSVRTRLHTLVGLADFYLNNGKLDRAAELVGLLLHHPGSHKDQRRLAAELQTVIERQMEANAVAQAVERGARLDLEAVIGAVLVELEQT